MSFIRDLFFSQRDSESRRIIDGYNEFLLLYQNKVRIARDIFPRIGKAVDDKLMEELREVRKLNNRIVLNLNSLFASTKKGALTVDVKSKNLFISDTVSKITDLQKPQQSELSVKLRQDINQGLEYLGFIIQILQRQNERIDKLEKKRDDTESSVILAQLISSEIANEAKMRILLRRFLRTLKLAIVKEGKEQVEDKLRQVKFVEVLAKGNELKDFYKIYVDSFPPEERDPYVIFANALRQRFSKKAVGGTFHLLVAKKDRETIGGLAFDFVKTPHFTFCIVWWDVVKAEYRRSGEYIGSGVFGRMVEIARQNNSIGIIAEINDPSKMTPKQVQEDSIDPLARIKFWQRCGVRPFFREYIQITCDPKVYTAYCSLFAFPLTERWASGLTAEDLKEVLYWMQVISNYYDPEFLKNYEPYQRMIRVIKSGTFFSYYTI